MSSVDCLLWVRAERDYCTEYQFSHPLRSVFYGLSSLASEAGKLLLLEALQKRSSSLVECRPSESQRSPAVRDSNLFGSNVVSSSSALGETN